MGHRKNDETSGLGAASGVPTGATRRGITPTDIQEKQFRLAIRGYNEREVDEFLDELTEEVARLHTESKRLREDLASQQTQVMRTSPAGIEEAEDILRRAREDAARIIADAEARARAIAAASSAGAMGAEAPERAPAAASAPGSFLRREKAFLQTLAGVIQSHADALKEDVRRLREAEAASRADAEQESGPPEGEAVAAAEVEEVASAEAVEAPIEAVEVQAEPSAMENRSMLEPAIAIGEEPDVEAPEEPSGEAEPAQPVEAVSEEAAAEEAAAEEAAAEEGPRVVVIPDDAPGSPSSWEDPLDVREDDPPAGLQGAQWEPRVAEDDEDEERSLKELFWGEQ